MLGNCVGIGMRTRSWRLDMDAFGVVAVGWVANMPVRSPIVACLKPAERGPTRAFVWHETPGKVSFWLYPVFLQHFAFDGNAEHFKWDFARAGRYGLLRHLQEA